MSRLWNPRIILFDSPVPISIGQGGLVPILAFGALFAATATRVGLAVPLAAAVGAVGGTASVLLHELGHVRVARKLTGIRPVGVSLITLGAATRLEGRYRSGRDQARVAIAGPGMSFALAVLITMALFAPIPAVMRGPLILLALLNVAIGALNLIPANPLDGHKILVGLIWSLIGTESSARRLIKRVGSAWIIVEASGAALLLLTRPLIGSASLVIGASFYGQKLFARRAPH